MIIVGVKLYKGSLVSHLPLLCLTSEFARASGILSLLNYSLLEVVNLNLLTT